MVEATSISRPFSGISWKPYFLAIGTLATLTIYVLAWAYPTFPGDEHALLQFHAMRNGWLDDMAIWLANLGLVWVFLPAAVALLTGLTLTRRYADAAMLMGGLAVIGTGNGLKVIVDRPRPDNALLESSLSSLSFPSGHSLLAVIVGGVLVYLVGLWVKPLLLRRSLQAGLVLVVIGMGASRVYLGLHWPSDVIGPYVLGVTALIGLVGL